MGGQDTGFLVVVVLVVPLVSRGGLSKWKLRAALEDLRTYYLRTTSSGWDGMDAEA